MLASKGVWQTKEVVYDENLGDECFVQTIKGAPKMGVKRSRPKVCVVANLVIPTKLSKPRSSIERLRTFCLLYAPMLASGKSC